MFIFENVGFVSHRCAKFHVSIIILILSAITLCSALVCSFSERKIQHCRISFLCLVNNRRPPMFPFVFPPGYPFSPAVLSQGSSSSHTPSGHSSSIANHGNNSFSQKRSNTHRYVRNRLVTTYIPLL